MDQQDIKSLRRYPGAKPFAEDEYRLFNGREEDVIALQDRMRLHNVNVLYGESGLGKSSLLKAGLVKTLKEQAGTDITLNVLAPYYKGGSVSPLQQLLNSLADTGSRSGSFLEEKFAAEGGQWSNQLWRLLKDKKICNPATEAFILIFDQFEELFTYPEADINEFKKLLSEVLFVKVPQQIRDSISERLGADDNFLSNEQAAQLFAPLNVRVLFAIDAEKMSLLNNLSDCFPGILQAVYELKPLTAAQARAAIVAPAQIVDPAFSAPPFSYSDDVVALIISALATGKKHYAARDTVEPFQLQLVCKHAEDLVIEKDMHKIGAEDLGNINEIFDDYYINIIRRLPAAEQLPARQLIEEKLVVDERRVSLPISFILRDGGVSSELLKKLLDSHILKPDQNDTVEISHDTFLPPILKYYEERRAEEIVAEEQRKKEEQILQLKEQQQQQLKDQQQQQQMELQQMENKRNRQAKNFAIAIGLLITVSLTTAIVWQQHQKAEKQNFLDKRAAAYKVLRQARDTARYDPTVALATAEKAVATLHPADTDARATMQKWIDDVKTSAFFYKNAVSVKPGTFIAISEDGTLIFTGGPTGHDSIRTAAGKLLRAFTTKSPVKAAGFSHNCKYLLLYTDRGRLGKLDLADGHTRLLGDEGVPVTMIQCSPDDRYFFTLGVDRKLRIFDSSGAVRAEPDAKDLTCAVFSRASDSLLTGSAQGDVTLWNSQGRNLSSYFYWNAPVSAIGFTPHGGRFVSANTRGFASIWHKKGNEKPLVSFGDLGSISAVLVVGFHKEVFGEDDKSNHGYNSLKVATGDTAGNIKIWFVKYASGDFKPENQDPSKNFDMLYWYSVLGELKGHKGRIEKLTMPNDTTIVSSAADGTVKEWNISKAVMMK